MGAGRPSLCLWGFPAGGATPFNFSGGATTYGHPATSGTYHGRSWAVLLNVWHGNWEWIVGILAVFAVIFIVMFVLGCIATGGLSHAAVAPAADTENTFGKAGRRGCSTT